MGPIGRAGEGDGLVVGRVAAALGVDEGGGHSAVLAYVCLLLRNKGTVEVFGRVDILRDAGMLRGKKVGCVECTR